eukprot:GHVT01019219.1.p1 GENE.GHVT01019219.1~~GHVT01019219.1.p1  ORF type:complete len:189 (+),score=6.02 GHVT01019219.1:1146-1712(+)
MSNLCQIFACAINATELPESFLTSHATADEKLSHFVSETFADAKSDSDVWHRQLASEFHGTRSLVGSQNLTASLQVMQQYEQTQKLTLGNLLQIRCWKSRGRSVLPVQVLEQAQVILRYCEETVMPPSHSCRPLESFLLVLECSTVLFCVFNRKYRRVFAPAMNIKSGKELRVLWPCAVTNTNVNYNL